MWTRCFTKPATRADATTDAIRSLRKLFAESERAHAATICATTVRNSSRRYGYVLLVTKCPQTQTAALLQELRRLLEIALRHAGRQGSELTADSLIEWLRIPSRRNKAPASDPRHRTAAGNTRSVPSPGRSHESEDRITAKNKTRCRVLFFCLTPNVRRRSCRKGYFRAARPGRRAS